jgi:hypothetical protein
MFSNTTALQGYSLYAPITADISSLVIFLDGLPSFASIGILDGRVLDGRGLHRLSSEIQNQYRHTATRILILAQYFCSLLGSLTSCESKGDADTTSKYKIVNGGGTSSSSILVRLIKRSLSYCACILDVGSTFSRVNRYCWT